MNRVSNQRSKKILVFLSILVMLSTLFSFSAFAANTATVKPTTKPTIKPTAQVTVKPTTKPVTQATTNPGTQVTATAGTQTGSTVAPSVSPTGDPNALPTENPVVTVQPTDDAQAAATATATAGAEKDKTPKTGDEMPLFIGGAVLFVSLAVMVTIVVVKKKANR